jgi:hypothetical protein
MEPVLVEAPETPHRFAKPMSLAEMKVKRMTIGMEMEALLEQIEVGTSWPVRKAIR